MDYHVIAVQKHSRIQDRLTRHVLEIIALDMKADDSSTISNRKIAELSRLSVNTVRERLDDILKTKEVQACPDGRNTRYCLNRELVPYDSVVQEAHEGNGITDGFVRLSDLQAMENRLHLAYETEAKRLYQLYQSIVSIVSVPQSSRDTVTAPNNSIYNNKKEYISLSLEEKLSKYKTALAIASKTPYAPGFNEEKYHAAALWCDEKGYTVEQVESFPAYWKDWGWGGKGGKPTLDVVLAEMDNCINHVDTRRGTARDKLVQTSATVVTDESGGHYG